MYLSFKVLDIFLRKSEKNNHQYAMLKQDDVLTRVLYLKLYYKILYYKDLRFMFEDIFINIDIKDYSKWLFIIKDRYKLNTMHLMDDFLKEQVLALRLSFKYNYLTLVDKIIKNASRNGYKRELYSTAAKNSVVIYNHYIEHMEELNADFINDLLSEISDDYKLTKYVLRSLPDLKKIDWYVIKNAELKNQESADLLKDKKMEIDLKAYNYILS